MIQQFSLNYDDGNYFQEDGQIKKAFRVLTKDDILQPYKFGHDFRSSNEGDDIGYNLITFTFWIYDIKNPRICSTNQCRVFIFSKNSCWDGLYGYALVSANKMVSISSNEQRPFD